MKEAAAPNGRGGEHYVGRRGGRRCWLWFIDRSRHVGGEGQCCGSVTLESVLAMSSGGPDGLPVHLLLRAWRAMLPEIKIVARFQLLTATGSPGLSFVVGSLRLTSLAGETGRKYT